MYNFLSDFIFADDRNPGFIYKDHLLPTHAFKKVEDLIFVDDKLPVKTAKITSLENLYKYSINFLHAIIDISLNTIFLVFIKL